MEKALKVLGLFMAFALLLGSDNAAAQSYPNKPITFVVGYPPGGSNDILARLVAKGLGEKYGQSVIIENKPGADGGIAAGYVAKVAPDGYKLLVGSSGTMTINPGMYRHLPFDPAKDFIPITLFASNPLVFAVNPSLKVNSLKELIAKAKAEPGKLSYAAGAPPMYLTAELFKQQTGINIVHIPYKGSGASIRAAISGEVPIVVVSVEPALAQVRAGKLVPLAVTGTERALHMPDVPTVAEATGLKFESGGWVGLFAPAGTPHAIVDKLYQEVAAVLKSESVKERFAALGYESTGSGMPPAEFNTFFRTNLAKWTKVTHDLNIHAD